MLPSNNTFQFVNSLWITSAVKGFSQQRILPGLPGSECRVFTVLNAIRQHIAKGDHLGTAHALPQSPWGQLIMNVLESLHWV